MEISKLSEYYSIATERAARQLSEMYESLHEDNTGDPLTDLEKVYNVSNVTLTMIKAELDLVVEAVKEYNGE